MSLSQLVSFVAIFGWKVFAHPLGTVEEREIGCKEVTFHVFGTAQNRNISSVDFTNLEEFTTALTNNDFSMFEVSGTQDIAAWYCEPSTLKLNVDKLQILNGPITTNREHWTALGGTPLSSSPLDLHNAAMYSWVDYARSEGYATLAIDHLGTGKSSHPDPTNVVQSPYEVELYHDLVRQIKSGDKGCPLPKKFEELVYVGCSYGSVTGNIIAKQYPKDFEAVILTGFSKSILPSLPGIAMLDPMPASAVEPERFGDLPAGYLVTPNETTRTASFFGNPEVVDFEAEVVKRFFEIKDVVSKGQFVSTYVGVVHAPEYQGRVLVLTGEQDEVFCGQGNSDLQPNPSCGNLLAESSELFPNAEYNWKSIPRAGHALHLHKSAHQTFEAAHAFLSGQRFGESR